MKRSEGNQTHKLILHFFFLCLIFCSCSGNDKRIDIKSSADAIQYYREAVTADQKKVYTTEEYVKAIQNWQQVADTVNHYILSDTTIAVNGTPAYEYENITDSIKLVFQAIGNQSHFSLQDVAYIKYHTSKNMLQEQYKAEVDTAKAFYQKVDDIKLLDLPGDKLLNAYTGFLKKQCKKEYHSRAEIEDFLWREETYFRSLLKHLAHFSQSDMTELFLLTEDACAAIFKAVHAKVISPEQAVIYMAMRTNRRMLQNSHASLDIILSGKITNDAQASGYLWMFVQTYISIDSYAISLLTDEQAKQYLELAKACPQVEKALISKKYLKKDTFQKLVDQILSIHITTL